MLSINESDGERRPARERRSPCKNVLALPYFRRATATPTSAAKPHKLSVAGSGTGEKSTRKRLVSNCAAVPLALDGRNVNVSNVKLAVASVKATATLPVPPMLPPLIVLRMLRPFVALRVSVIM